MVPAVGSVTTTPFDTELVLPDYQGACITNIVPALLEHDVIGRGWVPDRALDAEQVVVFVVDGLGWHQLLRRAEVAPTLVDAERVAVTTVAPSTTSAALTSLTTGCPPGEHGLVGYRMRIEGETLNALRWRTGNGDARERIVPAELQPVVPFSGRQPVVITKSEFRGSGFTQAHLGGTRFLGWSTPAMLVHEVRTALTAGERFVYVYYDGLDRIGHERGHGDSYDAELAFIDRLVSDLQQVLPDGAAMLVTADHGQVLTDDEIVPVDDGVLRETVAMSGEARFVWLHSAPNRSEALYERALAAHSEHAWVRTRQQVIDQGWLGPQVSRPAASRLGDVAMAARGVLAFEEQNPPSIHLFGRHGSVTAAEMHVPLICLDRDG